MSAKKLTEKEKRLDAALAQIEKTFGSGSVFRLGKTNTLKLDVIPTGIPQLDEALGVGGIPRGRIVEIFGAESTGKTALALQIAAQAQRVAGGQ